MDIESLVSTYGYPAVALGIAFEGETALIIAAFLAHRGYLELRWVLLLGFLATFTVDQLFFFLGRWRGPPFLRSHPHWAAKTERVRGLFQRWGATLALWFRFLYGLRTVTPFAIGMSGFPPDRFALLNATGGILWVLVIGLLGYAFGNALEALLGNLRRHEHVILVGMAAAGAVFWLLLKFVQDARSKAPPRKGSP